MATRFYFDLTAASTYETASINSNWDADFRSVGGGGFRQALTLTRGSTNNTGFSGSTGNLPVPPGYSCCNVFQYIFTDRVVIAGNVRAAYVGYRNNNGNNVDHAICAYIKNSSGTLVATILEFFPGPTNFYGFNPGHCSVIPSTAVTDSGYVTAIGDVLYIEVGLGWLAQSGGSTCGITIGCSTSKTDWLTSEDATADTSPTAKNPWFEFETTLAAATSADDFLMTLSGADITSRISVPSKAGLHFFDRSQNILSVWNGSDWKQMVASLNANGGTSLGGNVTFNNTTDINVTLTGSTFTWNAQALSTVADRTKTLTLTEDLSFGATLTASATWSAPYLSLAAPGGSLRPITIDANGHLAAAGGLPTSIAVLDFLEAVTTTAQIIGVRGSALQSGAGLASTIFPGAASMGVVGLAGRANVLSTNTVPAAAGFFFAQSNSQNATGDLTGVLAQTKIPPGVQGSRTNITGLKSLPITNLSNLSGTQTNWRDFWAVNVGAIAFAITNRVQFDADALTIGTNRINFRAGGASGGTVAYGFQSILHTGGTTRRSFIGDNSMECTANDFYCPTAAKGLLVKDAQASAEYWRIYPSVSGTTVKDATWTTDADGFSAFTRAASATGSVILNVQDAGTTAPAV